MTDDTVKARLTAVEERQLKLETEYSDLKVSLQAIKGEMKSIKDQNDVIKDRIDNGLSKTGYDTLNLVHELKTSMISGLKETCTQVKENTYFRKILTKIFITLVIIIALGGLVTGTYYVLRTNETHHGGH